MQRRSRIIVSGVLATVIGIGSQSRIALGAEGAPVIGAELSAAVPLKGTKNTADVGGAASVYAGYHLQFNEIVGLSWLVQPEFSFFPNNHPHEGDTRAGAKSDSDLISIMALGTGPRLTIGGETAQFFVDGRGAYFQDLGGPLNDYGPGYNVGGGVAFALAKNTSLSLVSRYNEAFMHAQPGSHENLRFVTAGIGLEHRFTAPPPAPAAAPPPPPPPPPAPPMKKKMILRGVNFDFDKSNIRADARPVLDDAIRTLKEYGDVQVSVGGHTDSRGTEAYNQALSVRRANSVATYLERGGIPRNRLEVRGFGESQPVASNDTDDGRAQNRRVELNVLP
jgi:outer membrane protein OmpA-like peptidoglycan-associated protein